MTALNIGKNRRFATKPLTTNALTRREKQEEKSRALFKRIANGDQNARNELISLHIPLIKWFAKKYRPSKDLREELNQEGMIGLFHAIDHFDLDRGTKFSSFAAKCIHGKMMKYLEDNNRFRIERKPLVSLITFQRITEFLIQRFHRPPTIAEIAKRIAVVQITKALEKNLDKKPTSKEILARYKEEKRVGAFEKYERKAWRLSLVKEWQSLNQAVQDTKISLEKDDEANSGFTANLSDEEIDIPDHSTRIDPIDRFDKKELSSVAAKVLGELTERQRSILEACLGFNQVSEQTYEEIAKNFGTSRQRIQQIETKAICRLQIPNKHRELEVFLDYYSK